MLRGFCGCFVPRRDGEQSLRPHPAPRSSSKNRDEAARFKLGLWLVFLRTRPHPEAIHGLITCPLLRTEDAPVTLEMPGCIGALYQEHSKGWGETMYILLLTSQLSPYKAM